MIVVPLTSTRDRYPFRVACVFGGTEGDLAVEQLRSVDRARLLRHLGMLDRDTSEALCDRLVELFQF